MLFSWESPFVVGAGTLNGNRIVWKMRRWHARDVERIREFNR